MVSSTLILSFVVLVAIEILVFVYRSLSSPLRSVPGPFLARFTRLWYCNRVYAGDFEQHNIALHRRYGPVVRLQPNHYSISDASAIKTIYSIGSEFPKSEWYGGFKHPSPDRWSLFPDRDIKRHADTRKRFASMYSMSSLIHYEPYVDECTEILVKRLRGFAHTGKPIDMAQWFRFYSFDVIGNITYGKGFGFLDRGDDIENIMLALDRTQLYGSLIGIFPEWHAPLFPLTSLLPWSGGAGRMAVMRFAQSLINQRRKKRTSGLDDIDPDRPQDFLERMMKAKEKGPEKVTDYHIFMMGQSNIIAGSDTTSASLSSILYYLLHSPEIFKKLRQEVDQSRSDGGISRPDITFKESQAMPYLHAVIKEALRMHAVSGLPLWRVVPQDGAELCGRHFPSGTVVGVNAWCSHYDEKIFGPDVGVFRPERWVEAEGDKDRLKVMDAHYMPFGLGSRTCIGKHISILEMSKLIPNLISMFDFDFVNPHKPWRTQNFWLVMPKDFQVNVRLREVPSAL